jgi:MinD-like ATPase involved in chromosome partitioning or flagellar assembly
MVEKEEIKMARKIAPVVLKRVKTLKIALMTSLDGGVGKTTLASVLSVAKGYTLLIDMDWEKADLSQLFRAPRKPGWLAPFIDGQRPYLHRVNPMLYLVPGYEAFELYQKYGEDVTGEFTDALVEWVEYLPRYVAALRIPIDTVIIDTTAALRTELLAKLQRQGIYSVFMTDRRLISRISDVKAEQYRRYMAYASLVVVNMVEKEEIKMARKIAPVVLKRVKIPEYYGETVANAILRDKDNKKAIDTVLSRIKTA